MCNFIVCLTSIRPCNPLYVGCSDHILTAQRLMQLKTQPAHPDSTASNAVIQLKEQPAHPDSAASNAAIQLKEQPAHPDSAASNAAIQLKE